MIEFHAAARLGHHRRHVQLEEIKVPAAAAMGVAGEGSDVAATNGEISLPEFDSFNRQCHYLDVFNQGKTPFKFSAANREPWIILSQTKATVKTDKRIWVSVDWDKIPHGATGAEIKISGAGRRVSVKIPAFNPSDPTRNSLHGFVEGDGRVSIEAEHFTKNSRAGENRWNNIPGYGNTLSAIRADGPDYVEATPKKDSPCLDYKMYRFHAGRVEVDAIMGPTLNFIPGRSLRYAVSFDDQAPRVVTIVPADFQAQNGNRDWEESVADNCRRVRSSHTLAAPGYHTLKIWMVDPGVALEKIVVNTGGVRSSYLGPPESFYHGFAPRDSSW